jgi:hypothetical protein
MELTYKAGGAGVMQTLCAGMTVLCAQLAGGVLAQATQEMLSYAEC